MCLLVYGSFMVDKHVVLVSSMSIPRILVSCHSTLKKGLGSLCMYSVYSGILMCMIFSLLHKIFSF